MTEFETAEMVLMTTHTIDSRYGRVQHPVELLEHLAAQINERPTEPMVQDHDSSQTIEVHHQEASVRPRSDGYHELVVTAELPAGSVEAWQEKAAAQGAPGGISVAYTEAIGEQPPDPCVRVVGDAADFTQEELLELSAGLADHPIGTHHLYQYSADAESVRLILGFIGSVAHAVPVELLSSWVADAVDAVRLKAAKLGRPPALDVDYRRTPDGSVDFSARYRPTGSDQAEETVRAIVDAVRQLSSDESGGDTT